MDQTPTPDIKREKENDRKRAGRNRTIDLTENECSSFEEEHHRLTGPVDSAGLVDRILHQDLREVIPHLPDSFVDLLFLDPPYNLTKSFDGSTFHEERPGVYREWFESWFVPLLRTLKPDASVYVCSDWRSSAIIHEILERHLIVRNRITWEREKGRGAKRNWKNNTEDIWFCTRSGSYTFNVEPIKIMKRVVAPYRNKDGSSRDWESSRNGNVRLTHPSNIWTDLTVPFWSMPENTDHPTQKPEKLLARILLASSRKGDIVLDPFAGSGTTLAVATKLDRRFVGVEREFRYACLAAKRIEMAKRSPSIQGYSGGVFWDRNLKPFPIQEDSTGQNDIRQEDTPNDEGDSPADLHRSTG